MNYYFQLQFKRLGRIFTEMKIPSFLALPIISLLFLLMAKLVFFKAPYPAWIFAALAISVLVRLGDYKRNDWLHSVFKEKTHRLIRLLENGFVIIPFTAYLIYENQYYVALGLLVIGLMMANIQIKQGRSRTIPTPFKRRPFEFIVGFRNAFWLIALAICLLVIGIVVANFNLSIASLVLIFLISLTNYSNPEDEFFVWVYAKNPTGFLIHKIGTALYGVSFLSIPFTIALCVFYPDYLLIILGLQLMGYLFLIAMVLAKYTAFPREINLPQGLFLFLSLWFPPLLLVIIPILFYQAKNNLKPLLEC